MAKPLVIVTETLNQQAADWLGQRTELIWCSHDQADQLGRLLPRAQGLVVRTYTQVNQALLEQAPQLKVVGRAGVGLDNFDLAACQQRQVQVVYTPDANTQAVVEYVLGLMLDAYRPRYTLPQPPGVVSPQQFHDLRKEQVGVQLDSLTLGILGLGRIGKRLGKVAGTLGMRVLANDLLDQAQLGLTADDPVTLVDKPTLYEQSDILSIHVDGRADNRHLIHTDVLRQLKPTCLLINAARGMLVDAQALADWARQHPGGRAILDVHDPEPPGLDYPLYGLANVRLLPHLASRTDDALANMSWVVRDVAAVLQGEQPRYPAWS